MKKKELELENKRLLDSHTILTTKLLKAQNHNNSLSDLVERLRSEVDDLIKQHDSLSNAAARAGREKSFLRKANDYLLKQLIY